jgi:hypothetical protein
VLDPFLRCEQNGFRPHRGTVTQILALRRVIEEARVHQSSLVVVFVDFRKAFDSVARGALPLVLRAYNVPQQLVSAIMAMHQNTTAAVMTPDGPSDLFSTSSGVLQGDTLAPFLFVLVLDWVLRTGLPTSGDGFVLCRRMSRRHPEKRLCVLGYADDLALLSSSATGAQRLFDGLVEAAARVGLVVNAQKTEVFTVPHDLPAEITCCDAAGRETLLPRCQRFVYLGGLVPQVSEDLARRRGLAWAAFRSVRIVLHSEALTDAARSQLFSAVIETVLLYNAETWTLSEALERQLDAAHASLLRAAFSERRGPGCITNEAPVQESAPPTTVSSAEAAATPAGWAPDSCRVILPRASSGCSAAVASGTAEARTGQDDNLPPMLLTFDCGPVAQARGVRFLRELAVSCVL